MRLLLLGPASTVCWALVARQGGVHEPWDADAYWQWWYPLSIGIAAVAGCSLGGRGWMAGVIVTFAQLPVVWAHAPIDATWITGAVMCAFLAVAPSVAALLASRLAANGPHR